MLNSEYYLYLVSFLWDARIVPFSSRVNLSVETWVAIGLIAGIVIILVGLIWVVFCVMLYKHQKERATDEDEDEDEVSDKIVWIGPHSTQFGAKLV